MNFFALLFFINTYIYIFINTNKQKKSTLRYNIWLVAAAFSRLCSTFFHQTTTTTVITKQNQDRTEPWHTKTPSLTTTREQQVPITNLFFTNSNNKKSQTYPHRQKLLLFFFCIFASLFSFSCSSSFRKLGYCLAVFLFMYI